MKRLILTDVGNILATFKFRHQLVREIMAPFSSADNVDITRLFGVNQQVDFRDEAFYHPLDMGAFNVYQLWQNLLSAHYISSEKLPYSLFFSLWCRHLQPIEETVELYRVLQEKYPLVAVSNGDSEGVRHILYHLIGSYGLRFEEIFISAERKCKKPELLNEVLDFVLSRGVDREECVFIDDIPAYTDAAVKLGIPAINWNGSSQPIAELHLPLKILEFV